MMLRMIALCLLPLIVSVSTAQDFLTCPDIVIEVMQNLDDLCADATRNQACYGNDSVVAVGTDDLQFVTIGDIANISDIAQLQLSQIDEDTGEWGVVLMQLQANIPDLLPGQNVTLLVFGDTEITDLDAQAVFFSTGIGTARCADAPPSGILIQTPQGLGEITFTINEVDIMLGSTLFVSAEAGNMMQLALLEGSALFHVGDQSYPLLGGSQAWIPIDEDLRPLPDAVPTFEGYQPDKGLFDTLYGFDETFELREPLEDDFIEEMLATYENDESLCGIDPFPDCEDVIQSLGGELAPPASQPNIPGDTGTPDNNQTNADDDDHDDDDTDDDSDDD